MSTVVFPAKDIQYTVGLLTIQEGLGLNENDAEMNFIIDPGAINIEEYDGQQDPDLDDYPDNDWHRLWYQTRSILNNFYK